MDVNLFSQINPSVEEGVENDFYGKVLEQRQDPAIPQSNINEPAHDENSANNPEPGQALAGFTENRKTCFTINEKIQS